MVEAFTLVFDSSEAGRLQILSTRCCFRFLSQLECEVTAIHESKHKASHSFKDFVLTTVRDRLYSSYICIPWYLECAKAPAKVQALTDNHFEFCLSGMPVVWPPRQILFLVNIQKHFLLVTSRKGLSITCLCDGQAEKHCP